MRGIQEMSVIPNHVGVTHTMPDYLENIHAFMKISLMAAWSWATDHKERVLTTGSEN